MFARSLVVAGALAGLLALPSAANAATYAFDFTSTDGTLVANIDFTVDASNMVTSITGTVDVSGDPQTISGIVNNPNFSAPSYSPDDNFIYDNVYYGASANPNPIFDIYGILFTTTENPNGYWNLWGTGFNNYSLYESVGTPYYWPVAQTMVPEPATWALMLLGFGGLGLGGVRKNRNISARIAA